MCLKKQILNWYFQHQRMLPWRQNIDPYSIWLSEVILQQTRVDQGIEYYQRFIKSYPDVCKLAEASEDEVLKLWQGLGYYSRARNLLSTAQKICEEHNGEFPKTSKELLQLKGIGPYTAAAISSICYNEVNPAIDGNVYRVLSRIFNLDVPIDTAKGRKIFQKLSEDLISKRDPGNYNQAIMEFGALVCTPKKPKCTACIFHESCLALQFQVIDQRPQKQGKVKMKSRYFNYLIPIFDYRGQFYTVLKKRATNDIWAGLWEFPLFEGGNLFQAEELLDASRLKLQLPSSLIEQLGPDVKRILTHRCIHCRFYSFSFSVEFMMEFQDYQVVAWSEIHDKAVPKPIEKIISTIPIK